MSYGKVTGRHLSAVPARRWAAAAIVGLFSLALGAEAASAFVALANVPTGPVRYRVKQEFLDAGYLAPSLQGADAAWQVQGLSSLSDFIPNTSLGAGRDIGTYQAESSTELGRATIGCDSNDTCFMNFDPDNALWNTTSEVRPSPWVDFITVAVHEFGHWVGLYHFCDPVQLDEAECQKAPLLSSDPGNSPRMFSTIGYGEVSRNITQDDANGMLAVRGGAELLANANLNSNSPFFGWQFLPPSGSAGNFFWYGTFLQYNGAGFPGSSEYQDIDYRSQTGGTFSNVRDPKASIQGSADALHATVAVWSLEAGQNFNFGCNLSASSISICQTIQYWTPPAGTKRIRFQVYNDGIGNMSIDDLRLVRG